MLRRRRFVFAMALLGLPEQIGEGCVVDAESPSGKQRLDLLEQPAVAVWIAERGERAVAGVIRRGSADSSALAIGLKLSTRSPGVEYLTDRDAAGREFLSGFFDVVDDQIEALGGARRGGGDLRAELDRTRRAGWCELDDAEAVIKGEIGVEPPPEAPVKALGAIDVGHRDHD